MNEGKKIDSLFNILNMRNNKSFNTDNDNLNNDDMTNRKITLFY